MIKTYGRVRYVWLFAFCYSLLLSLLFQKFLLPLMPTLHAGNGLLKNDAFNYHQSAQILADQIHVHGWSVWAPWSSLTNTTGNVGVLAALYAMFSPNPELILPVNAALNATSAVLLLMIGRMLWPSQVGNWAGLLAGVMFTISPAALSWYSQPLKDCYAITGMLMIFYSWIVIFQHRSGWRGVFAPYAFMVGGALMLAFVKPHYLKLLLLALVLNILVASLAFVRERYPHRLRALAFYLLTGIFIAMIIVAIKPYQSNYTSGEQYAEGGVGSGAIGGGAVSGGAINWKWQSTSWLPDPLERNLEIVSRTRLGMIYFNKQVASGSLIDEDSQPRSAVEVLEYLPRALQVGLFSPFPNTWLERQSATRLVAAAETALWYLIFPGLILALYYKRSLAISMLLVFTAYFLAVFSFVTPNAGTLYRYRFVFEYMLMLGAFAGWVQFYMNRRKARGGGPGVASSQEKLLGGAITVSALTLAGYIGFFLRDIILVRWLGAGDEVDVFFLGSMIPMFIISVAAMPVGQSLISVFTGGEGEKKSDSRRLLSATILWLIPFLAVLSLLLHNLTPLMDAALGWNFPAEKLASIHMVMNVYILIMLAGSLIIIANAVLNATSSLVFPAVAQLAVPFVVIITLLLYGTSYGIYPVVYAMLIGQVVNLIWVIYELWRQGMLDLFRLEWVSPVKYFPFRQYLVLVAAALSSALMVPLANAIAATMPPGSVTTVGIGLKVIMLITGVIGMGVTTVLLPYFSNLVSKSHHATARSDLFLFLLLGTVISVPVALGLRELAGPLVNLLMADSIWSYENVLELIRTVQYGVAQLPFYICSLIIMKYITAYQRSRAIFLIACVSITIMLALGFYLAGELGVSGISLALTVSMAGSAMLLLWYVCHLQHLPVSNCLLLGANWGIAILLFIGLHFHLIAMLVVLGLVFVWLGYLNWKRLIVEMDADVMEREVGLA